MVRMLSVTDSRNLARLMKGIGVDPYGIKIMLPKAISYVIKVTHLSNIAANILKQEMLSLGGDVAVARGALTGKVSRTDCLIMANLSQLNRLQNKLKKQPFGLGSLSLNISSAIRNYQTDKFIINIGKYKLNLGRRPYIMGILNLTPDSFSGDGWFGVKGSEFGVRSVGNRMRGLVDFAQKMIEDGADIIDVGGESSRPGAKPVPLKEELNRVIPAIKILSKKLKIPISIDTYKPEVAKQALDNSACIINDITGLRNSKMARIIAKYKAAVIIMHMKGRPQIMQENPQYKCLIDEIIDYLKAAILRAKDAGIDEGKIIVDPGLGFGKTFEHNLEILNNLNDFKVLGRPVLVGPSRKSFIGKILSEPPQERIFGTVSACVLAARNGAKLLRVHDVKGVKQALKVLSVITTK